MNVPEAIELFHNEMINELNQNITDDALLSTLVDGVKEAANTVYNTYIAEQDEA